MKDNAVYMGCLIVQAIFLIVLFVSAILLSACLLSLLLPNPYLAAVICSARVGAYCLKNIKLPAMN
jgi:hypothetical protein